MKQDEKIIKVAAAQVAPVFLDRTKTVDRACELIREAGSNGAKFILFPEAFISGYPDWVWLLPNSSGRELNALYVELVNNAVSVPDASTEKLCEAAAGACITVAIGIHELNSESSGGTLYNSLLYISHEGAVMGVHRKLIPTGGERLVWGQGDGSTLHTIDTPAGRLGGLICWENYMPLARYALIAEGVQILASPTWDKSENWLASLRHIAREGGMFVMGCCMAVQKDDIPDSYSFKALYPEDREWINTGNSCIIDPSGKFLAVPMEKTTGLLYADLDMDLIPSAKRMFDAAGHYARPDVFKFAVDRTSNQNME